MDDARAVEPGTLSLVATPIGNLADVTLRALQVLRAADVIAAEDTRHTRKLLSHHAVTGKELVALHAHSTERDVARLVERMRDGASVALVTDAGTPGVSDPGDALVRAAIEAGVRVVPIPGPSAVLAALVASGLCTGGAFRFLGFLPRSGTEREEALGRAAATPEPVVLFEAPGRVQDTLIALARATPSRPACVARELTKVHEELVRGTLGELAGAAREWRGETVIVLGPHRAAEAVVDDASLDVRIAEELERGEPTRRIAERLAAWSGRPKREVYERVLRMKK